MYLNSSQLVSEAAEPALLHALTPWAERLRTAVSTASVWDVFGGMDRRRDEIHMSGVPISHSYLTKGPHVKVTQSLAALIVVGIFAAPVFAAGIVSAPAAAPAPATTAAAMTTDAASTPKAEAKHKKKYAHRKAHRAAAKSEIKTDSTSIPKAITPIGQ